ncbi:MAG: ATP-binding cassette domain-containing protein [Ignavibacteriota bacterium]
MSAIQLENVTKTFGDTAAVNDLSLAVPEGAVYGFIGPNGSGKTTTMRMIVNITAGDAGRCAVLAALGRTGGRGGVDSGSFVGCRAHLPYRRPDAGQDAQRRRVGALGDDGVRRCDS